MKNVEKYFGSQVYNSHTKGKLITRGKYGHCLDHYCRDCRNLIARERLHSNLAKGLCGCGRVLASKSKCQHCLTADKVYRIFCRKAVLKHYGTVCFCCGEWREEFLTVDHIFGGGSKHKRERKRDIYIWLVKHNFPPEYRTACFNCNCAMGRCGYCPHDYEHSRQRSA
jgi:hypothetical protein